MGSEDTKANSQDHLSQKARKLQKEAEKSRLQKAKRRDKVS
jgi:hypothetical protein